MNFRFVVVSAKDLPCADVNGLSDPFVVVYETALAKLRIGTTSIAKHTLNPTWNEAFPFHGIRGLKFKLIIWDYDCVGKNDKLGRVLLDPTNLVIGEDVWIPIQIGSGTLQEGAQPQICVRLEYISTAVFPSSNLSTNSSPIPYNFTLYFRLTYDPPYEPEFPINKFKVFDEHNFYHALTFLDLTLIPFLPTGEVKTHAFFRDGNTIPISHTYGTVGCSSTFYGPVIRVDSKSLFQPPITPNQQPEDLPAKCAVLTISSASEVPLSDFKTVTVDLLICDETKPSSPSTTIITAFGADHEKNCLERPTGTLYLYKQYQCTYEEGTTCAASLLLVPGEKGVEINELNWFVPNSTQFLQPRSPMEALPEISQLAGFSNANLNDRLITKPSFVPRQLNSLAKAMCKKKLELFTLEFNAIYKRPIVLHLGAIVFDKSFQQIGVCTECEPFSKRAIQHLGIVPTLGNSTQTIQVDFKKLPPESFYICFYATSSLENNEKRERAYAYVTINKEAKIEKVPIPSTKINAMCMYGVLIRTTAGWDLGVSVDEWKQANGNVNAFQVSAFVTDALSRVIPSV